MQPITSQLEGVFSIAHLIIFICIANLFLHPGMESSLVIIASFALLAWRWKLSPQAGKRASVDEVRQLKTDVSQITQEMKKLTLKYGFR